MREEDFRERPLDVLPHLQNFLGDEGFKVLKPAMIAQVRKTFGIVENTADIPRLVELARKAYLKADLSK